MSNIFSRATVSQTLAGLVKSAGQLLGTNTNDTAAAGYVGETITASRLLSAAASLTTNTPLNVLAAPLSLTAGDWLVWCAVGFNPAATTTLTQLKYAISQTSATLPASDTTGVFNTSGEIQGAFNQASAANGAVLTYDLAQVRVQLSTTTSFYLVAQATFLISTMTTFGLISAMRTR